MLDPQLGELAEACGIEHGYHDIWGVWHEASPATVSALLSAMDRLQQRTATPGADLPHQALPGTVVIRLSDPSVPVRLAPASKGGTLSWRVAREDGSVIEGEARTALLPFAARCPTEGGRRSAALLPLPGIPTGYHHLEVFENGQPLGKATLIVTPDHCYQPEAAAHGKRLWGVSLQLYGLRSAHNWGLGDFTDLSEAVEQWGKRGAAFVGVNPLHALYLDTPAHASPYSPSSRLFLNPLYLDIEAMEDFAACAAARELRRSAAFNAAIEELRARDLVDYPGVAEIKKQMFEFLHAEFRRHKAGGPSERTTAFECFCREGGESLRRYALFEALHEHFRALDPATGSWQQWPAAYRDPASDDVAKFEAENAGRVEYFLYLQWQAGLQLAAARESCRKAGLDIGLYLDLAVSIDRGGADAWAHQQVYALRASVGAPPDEFNPDGQDWGLPPYNPPALQDSGYALFVQTLRANMACSGALRIDHVMGLARLFWVPPGVSAAEGAYVRYPLEDLLAIVALESERSRCMVIGEDLGTVPVQLRHALREWGVLSYRLLMFERDSEGRFQRPEDFPAQSMVSFSTHDLPTFVGYWRSQEDAVRKALVAAVAAAGLLPQGASESRDLDPDTLSHLSHAVHTYLARSPARLLAVQLDDAVGAAEQANVPGTPDEPPNWRRKTPATLEAMRADETLQFLGQQLTDARSTAGPPAERSQ